MISLALLEISTIHVRFTKRRPSSAHLVVAKRQDTAESVLSVCCTSASTDRFDDEKGPLHE